MSKDVKPKQRIGQGKGARRKRIIIWSVFVVLLAAGGYAAYRYAGQTKVEVAVARVARSEFVDAVFTRGEIRSANSVLISAPQVPDLQITRLATAGDRVERGDIIVEFDAANQEQQFLQYSTTAETVESQAVQTRASHKITDEADAMNLMTAEYNLERARLEASKAEVISEIEGAKNRISVTLSEGELGQVETAITAHEVSQEADLQRLNQRKTLAERNVERVKGYLSNTVLRAPIGGIVHILNNFRASGSFGSAPPPFKEGDNVWTGAAIAEIPDLSDMRLEMDLDEVDRGRIAVGQQMRIRVDSIPDKEFPATLDWISPIASVNLGGLSSAKTFPARATLTELDDRLRPGMSGTAQIVIEKLENVIVIESRASFTDNGRPAVWVQRGDKFEIRPIEVGKRNDSYVVVLSGLEEGEIIALEDPEEAAKRANKL